jgi:hypothetical protein
MPQAGLSKNSSSQLPSAIKINKNSHLYGKLYVPWIDTATAAISCPHGVKRSTVRPLLHHFMRPGGSDLIPRRDILIPRYVFRGPDIPHRAVVLILDSAISFECLRNMALRLLVNSAVTLRNSTGDLIVASL